MFVKTLAFQDKIQCFDSDQSISTFPHTFMLRRNLGFKSQFKHIFARIHEAGLISKLIQDFQNEKINCNDALVSDAKPLTIYSFISCVIFFTVGLSFAFISRILEEIIFRKANKMNAHQFWKFADKIIVGKRHFVLLENNHLN